MNSPALVRLLFSRPLHGRRGLSLMELLIATTISIMIMGATVTLFGVVGERINGGRAMIEVSDRLRSTQNLLLRDLRGRTASFLPWEQPSAGSGYFELYKGALQDTSPTVPDPNLGVLRGHVQDVLMFTTRSPDAPFTGRFLPTVAGASPTTIESQVAEVIWYMQPSLSYQGNPANPPTYTLYRRQFLVVPSPVPLPLPAPNSQYKNPMVWFYDNYDISAHRQGGSMVANSLADLAYRENRFAHDPANYPFLLLFPPVPPAKDPNNSNPANFNPDSLTPFQPPYLPNGSLDANFGSQRYGEDAVLTNVLSFDVKVWDPGAPVLADRSQRPLVPGDAGYGDSKDPTTNQYNQGEYISWIKAAKSAGPGAPPVYPTTWNGVPVQYGAYVDLNYGGNLLTATYPVQADGSAYPNTPNKPYFPTFGVGIPTPYFVGPFYGLGFQTNATWFDSGSAGNEYYYKGMAATRYNQSNNGFDNDGNGIVNDPGERVTTSPYPVPLRGVQIKIRVYEPSTRQVREITVSETFLPD